MPRYRLTLEYDGRGFVGWQRQTSGLGVQQAVEDAVTAFTGETATVQGAGRTDSGVHALAQVAHVDLTKEWPADTVRDALNAYLRDHQAAVLAAEVAADDFHARFSAVERAYRYRIVNRRAPLALDAGLAWWMPTALDADAMAAAAPVLLGTHDFTSFRASECQAKSPVKTLDELSVRRFGAEIEIVARARSFLHHQVRNIVGTLALVGEGKWTARDLADALAARDRAAGGPTAPPDGLYLTGVRYDGAPD
ncbi:MAG: tRNA pseudouridine(38-40) synthase TruA [Rhodospirillaceae bacterium]